MQGGVIVFQANHAPRKVELPWTFDVLAIAMVLAVPAAILRFAWIRLPKVREWIVERVARRDPRDLVASAWIKSLDDDAKIRFAAMIAILIPLAGGLSLATIMWLSDEAGAARAFDIGKVLGAVLGGIVAIGGLYYTHKRHEQSDEQLKKTTEQLGLTRDQLRITEEGNFTARFTHAVEMLGQNREEKDGTGGSRTVANLEVRLGGIHALERLAVDSAKDRPAIFKILCSYVRENSKWNDAKQWETDEAIAMWKEAPKVEGRAPLRFPPPRTDVQTALTVLGASLWNRAALPQSERPPVDLRGADLRGADLMKAHLEGANLERAHLEGAFLWMAHFEDGSLVRAHLEGADLVEAHLEGADLQEAHLEGADLEKAHLGGTMLYGAHLEGAYLVRAVLEGAELWEAHLEGATILYAEGLTYAQLVNASGDAKTRPPEGLTRPAHWSKKSGGSENSGGSETAERPSGEEVPGSGEVPPASELSVPAPENVPPTSGEDSPASGEVPPAPEKVPPATGSSPRKSRKSGPKRSG